MKTAKLLIALSLALPFAACPADDGEDDGASTDPTGDTGTMTMTGADDAPESGDDVADDAPETGADDAPDTGADDAPDTGADDGGGMACTHTCAADGDCMIGGMDVGLICEGSSCALANPCTADDVCVAQLSGWSFTPCTMGGGECMATMQTCVDLGDGTGGCASAPSEFFMCDSVPGWGETMQTNLDDGSEVTVCGNTMGVCDTELGFCYTPCVDDTTCGTLVCNTGTGMCECDSDDDCGEGGTCSAGVCSVPGCVDDTDCAENPFDGGMYGCQ
jgi:hypothetical protein